MLPVIVIGAGPAGLAVAASLHKEGIPYRLLEKSAFLAPAWRNHYDRLHLHTVKELSHLPGLDFPEDYPRFVSRAQLVSYLESYAEQFSIQPELGVSVVSIQKSGDDLWQIVCESGEQIETKFCVFCTGVNRQAFIPKVPGIEDFAGDIMHSQDYKNPKAYADKRALTVGMGNSGAEIALDLSEGAAFSGLSVRGPVNIVPRELFGRSTQQTALKLAKLPQFIGDQMGVLLRKITVGDLRKYGIETPKLPPAAQLRKEGKTPVIDIGTVAAIKAGKIKVFPGLKEIKSKTVVFANGVEEAFDVIVFATGYRAGLKELFPALEEDVLDHQDLPKTIAAAGDKKGLYFVGFDNYSPGGGLGIIRRDAPLVAASIAKRYNQ